MSISHKAITRTAKRTNNTLYRRNEGNYNNNRIILT